LNFLLEEASKIFFLILKFFGVTSNNSSDLKETIASSKTKTFGGDNLIYSSFDVDLTFEVAFSLQGLTSTSPSLFNSPIT